MHLSNIDIKNFRSFKEINIDLQSGLNLFVGRNNTGKTNLLQAIRHALGPAASRGESLWLDRDDFYRKAAGIEPETSMSVTLTFTDLSEAQRAHFYEIIDFDLVNLTNSKAVVKFEASWPIDKKRASIKRTGGPLTVEQPEIPTPILESLPITFLPALRDAEAALAPGYRSRLALLLRDIIKRDKSNAKEEIVAIFSNANNKLENQEIISETVESLQKTTRNIAGSDSEPSTIRTAEADFEKILRTLQVQMTKSPIGALSANGLGLNNLLYIAVVLEHLKSPELVECPLLLVEEPEAHLHPQLAILLANHLKATNAPQTLVTTHSPTLAASVPPNRVHVLFTDTKTKQPTCNSIANSGMDQMEQNQLQRMMDITRATLYFAKGVILVEGISEALLIPVLARRLGYDLAQYHISVIPICGVAFETFKKLLASGVLGIPVAIISDADPKVNRGNNWKTDIPDENNDGFKLCDRMEKLLNLFENHTNVKVFHSKLTLEYDLAEAGENNAKLMAEVWETCFKGKPGTFNKASISGADMNRAEKALTTWRGICRADHSGSKAEFAHRLAARLIGEDGSGPEPLNFVPPTYIKEAIEHVINSLHSSTHMDDSMS